MVRDRVAKILVGMNIKDTLIVLMSLASSTAILILKMSRADWMEMCGEFFDRRDREARSIQ